VVEGLSEAYSRSEIQAVNVILDLIIEGSGKRDPCEDHMIHSHLANPWDNYTVILFKGSRYVLMSVYWAFASHLSHISSSHYLALSPPPYLLPTLLLGDEVSITGVTDVT
jgi:hypothetical protein